MPDPAQPADAPNESHSAFPLGIAFGAAAGVLLGAVTGNWGVWLPIAMGVGTALGLSLTARDTGRP